MLTEWLFRLWEFIGSPQFQPVLTVLQFFVVALLIPMFRRLSTIYYNIMAIPGIQSDIRKLFTATNRLKRQVAHLEDNANLRHAENVEWQKGHPAE